MFLLSGKHVILTGKWSFHPTNGGKVSQDCDGRRARWVASRIYLFSSSNFNWQMTPSTASCFKKRLKQVWVNCEDWWSARCLHELGSTIIMRCWYWYWFHSIARLTCLVFYEMFEQGKQKGQLIDAKSSSTMSKQGDILFLSLECWQSDVYCCFQSICLQNLHQLLGRYWGMCLFIVSIQNMLWSVNIKLV